MSDSKLFQMVAERIEQVKNCVSEAAKRSERNSDSVRLIVVTKYAAPDNPIIPAMIAAGCRDLGESRPQDLLDKIDALGTPSSEIDPIRWHLIGSLQRNKARKILSCVDLIHSVDSLRLAEALNRIAEEEKREANILLEVNIACDTNKLGFSASDFPRILAPLGELKSLRVQGLMCMSGLDSAESDIRREFAGLRNIAESSKSYAAENTLLKELSMGMSDDFEIAVEEGATLVRIGSRLYPDSFHQ